MKKIFLLVLLVGFLKVEAQTSTFSVADSLFAKGRYQLALQNLKTKESSFLSNYKKAVIYEAIDDYKKAAQFLEEAISLKDDTNAKLKLAKIYKRLKLSNKAVSIYEEILEKDSLNLILKYQLGKLYITTKKAKKAISIFKYLIDKDATNANYAYQLAIAFGIDKNRNSMIDSFIDTYKKDSTHLKAIIGLALSFDKLKDKDSTQLFVDKGLILDKNHSSLNKLKINYLYQNKKYIEAIPLLLNLDTLQVKDIYNKTMLGRTYYKLDSLEKAKKYFIQLSYIDKEDYKSQTYLGHIALKEKDFDTARMRYMMATFRGKEKRDEEFYGLATVYLETNKPIQAIKAFKEAYEENSRNYRALYQIAKVSDDYYKDKKIAYKYYVKYIERFYEGDKDIANFVRNRIGEIKKEYFMKGETLK